MKIVQIATSDIQGGAARAAYRLHQGLRLAGQESLVLSRHRKSDDPFVSALADLGSGYKAWPRANELWAEVQPHYIDTNRTELSNTLFSFPYPAIDLSDIEQIQQADVLNLHWVAWFQSAETIAALLELGKPVVWTLHDMAPFTGGCHYSAGCQNYQASCQACPQLKDDRYGLPEIILENKLAHLSAYPNLTIVTPSRWLGDCARKSQVFGNHRVEVIPYGLDTNLFRPIAKNTARNYLVIPDDTIVLLFGADSNLEHRKGANLLIEALKKCCQDPTVKALIEAGKVRILNFGYGFSGLEDLDIPVTALGHIDSDEKLCHAYSSATVLLLPSLEDNLPNLMLEAMSCGTPLITFAVGGMPDLVEDGKTGRLVPPFDIDVFAEVITHSLTHPDIYEAMGLAARDKIVQGYSLEKQANEYLALYRELLANHPHNQPTLTASQKAGSGLSLLENQKAALVAIQAGQVALAKERKTALELNNKVIQTETQVQAAQAELQAAQAELQTAQAELQTAQAELQTTQAQLQTTQAEIIVMQSSKFWKVRGAWFKLKSLVRMRLPKSLHSSYIQMLAKNGMVRFSYEISKKPMKLVLNQPTRPKPIKLSQKYFRTQLNSKSIPLISIVTPSYNQAQYIERTLDSVLSQEYPKLEYLIQDGASTDRTTDILTEYRNKVTHIDSRPDTGQANAINLGFAKATGEIMAWLNSDDLLLPGSLAYVANFFNDHPDVDVVYGHRLLINSENQTIGKWVLPPHDNDVVTWADYIPQETMFWRRSIWDKAGAYLDESYKFALDWELILRFREQGAKFVRLPRFLGAFRVYPEQKTSAWNSIGQKEMDQLRFKCHHRYITQAEVDQRISSYRKQAWKYYWLDRLKLLKY